MHVVFFWGVFLLRFIGFDLLLDVRHELVLSRLLLLLLLHGLSTVAWFGSWIVYHRIAGRIVAWIVVCCLVCVTDCDLLLDVCDGLCVMVSWLPCCCMGYDCVAWCMSWIVHHGF